MKNLIRCNRVYFLRFILLLICEILIARFAHDRFIRPYFGDLLVVILMYCFIKSFLDLPALPTCLGVLVFSYLLETLQYLQIVQKLGLQHSAIARTVIGTSFEWIDMIAYTAGGAVVLYLENTFVKKNTVKKAVKDAI